MANLPCQDQMIPPSHCHRTPYFLIWDMVERQRGKALLLVHRYIWLYQVRLFYHLQSIQQSMREIVSKLRGPKCEATQGISQARVNSLCHSLAVDPVAWLIRLQVHSD